LSIERYGVIPLSPTAGLISWVPNCDTMHDLIREYRDNKNVILSMEQKLILQVTEGENGYDLLTHIQKIEVRQL
jgi:FKBP12-rapamycin complex-associated protein